MPFPEVAVEQDEPAVMRVSSQPETESSGPADSQVDPLQSHGMVDPLQSSQGVPATFAADMYGSAKGFGPPTFTADMYGSEETPQKTRKKTPMEKLFGLFTPKQHDGGVGKLRLGSLVGKDTGSKGKAMDMGHLQNTATVGRAAGAMYSPASALHNYAGQGQNPSQAIRHNWDSNSGSLGDTLGDISGGVKAGFGGLSVGSDITKGIYRGMKGEWEGVQNAVGDGLGHTVDAVRFGMTAAGSTAAEVSPLGIASSGLSMLNEANKFRHARRRGGIASGALGTLAERESRNHTEGHSSYESRDPSTPFPLIHGPEPLLQSKGLSTRIRDQYQAKAARQVLSTTKKQKRRAALNGTAATLVTAGRATTLATGATGAGGAAGAGLEVAGRGLKAGGGMFRGAKRMWRNRLGKKSNPELTKGRLVTDGKDEAKNDYAKSHSAMVTASTIEKMAKTDNAAGVELLRGLGFGTLAVKRYKEGKVPHVGEIYGKLRKR